MEKLLAFGLLLGPLCQGGFQMGGGIAGQGAIPSDEKTLVNKNNAKVQNNKVKPFSQMLAKGCGKQFYILLFK